MAANVYALALAIPLLLVLGGPFVWLWGWEAIPAGLDAWLDQPLWMFAALIGGVLIHEGLHASAWRLAADLPPGSVRIGFNWKALTPYAHCSAPMPARAYRIGAATPGIVLGLVPCVIAWATGSGQWMTFGLLFTLAAGGDALILWLLRGVGGRQFVVDHPTRAGCLIVEPDALSAGASSSLAHELHSTLGVDAPSTDASMSIPTVHVTLGAPDRSASWEAGESFDAFLASAEDLVQLWTSTYTRAVVPDDIIERVAALPGEWKLLAMAADWCIDAAPVLPFVVRLAEAMPTLEYRQLERDDHLELMDEHLTNGRSRSIPIVILLDGEGKERGWWGPRPADLQAWVLSDEAQAMEKEERYKRARQWFARDKGRTALHEIVTMMEAAVGDVA